MIKKIRSYLSGMREKYHAMLALVIKIDDKRLYQQTNIIYLTEPGCATHHTAIYHVIQNEKETGTRPDWLDPFVKNIYLPPCVKATFQNAEIIGNGIVIDENGCLQIESTVFQKEYLNRLKQNHLLILRKLMVPLRIDCEVIVVADYLSSNYFHWVLEGLGRLAAYKLAGNGFEGKKIAISPHAPSFVKDSLACLFGIEENQLIRLGIQTSRIAAKAVTLIGYLHQRDSSTLYIDIYNPRVYKLFRLLMMAGTVEKTYPKRIIIVRKNVPERQWLNLAALEEALNGYGFKSILPDSLTFSEQFQHFRAAEIVITIHGAAIANLVFAEKCSLLIEFFPSSRRLSDAADMYQITQNTGISHYLVIAEDDGALTQNIRVSPGSIEIIKTLLQNGAGTQLNSGS